MRRKKQENNEDNKSMMISISFSVIIGEGHTFTLVTGSHESVSGKTKNNTASWRELDSRIIILGQYILSQTNENRFTIEKKKLA